MNEINNSILSAFDIVIADNIRKIKKDTTIQATIVDVSEADKGHYKIKYENAILDVWTDDLKTEYDIDEAVYVTVPEGDKSNKMFILGRVKSKEDKPYVEYTDPNLLYDLVGPDYTTILHNLDELAVFCGLNSNTERDEDSQEAEPILADLLPYSQKYEYIQIAADFKYRPNRYYDDNNQEIYKIEKNGYYALELKFKDQNNVEKSYIFDTSQMLGDPFAPHDYFRRTVTLKADKGTLKELINISLLSTGFNRGKEKESYEESENREIFVKNISFSFAEPIADGEIYSANILTPYGVFYTDGVGENNAPIYKNLKLIPQLKYKGKKIESNYKCEWFEQDVSITSASGDYRPSGGRGWKFLEEKDAYMADKAYYINAIQTSPTWYSKRFKVVITYDKITRVKEIDVYRTMGAYSEGVYYIILYDKNFNNEISLTVNEATYNSDTNKTIYTPVTDESYSFSWGYLDVNGNLTLDEETKGNCLKVFAENIHSNREYLCTLANDGKYIDTLRYLITTEVKDALFTVEFITENNGVFLYKENGYISVEDWSRQRDLNFEILWGGTPEPYNYRWILDGMPIDEVQNLTGLEGERYTPDSSLISYDLTSTFLGSGDYDSREQNNGACQPAIHYWLSQTFRQDLSANKIQLEITVNDIQYYYTFNFSLSKQGNNGTNGTDYQMTVSLISNPLRYSGGKWANDTATYEINIYKNGELITPTANTLKASLPRQYYEKSIFTQLVKKENAEILEVPNNAIVINNTELKLTAIGDELKYQNFITITYTPEPPEANSKERVYILTYILPVQINEGTTTAVFNFPTIMYDQAGYNPDYYKNDLKTFYTPTAQASTITNISLSETTGTLYSIDTVQPTKLVERPTPILDDEGQYTYEQDKGYKYETINGGTKYLKSTKDADETFWESIKYQIDDSGNKIVTYESVEDSDADPIQRLVVESRYDAKKAFNVLNIKDKNGTLHIPLLALLNKYSLVNINEWDGNSVVVDNDKGVIYAPQIAAGDKDNNNTFSGVIMGEYVVDDTSEGLGLWGFYKGDSTFGMRVDGSAYFGKSGSGRIEINGSGTGTIKSGNYSKENKTGMLIDFTDGNIYAPSFSLKSDNGNSGQFLFELPTDTSNQSHFKIQAPNTSGVLNDVFYIGANDYYLQSVDYSLGVADDPDTDENEGKAPTGLRIDLKNSFIKAPGFTINGNGVGNVFNFNLDESASFSITKNNSKTIFYAHGTSGYYLRSTNHTTAENDENVTLTGLNIDLDYGSISSPYFTINGNGNAWFSGSITASEISGTFTGTLNALGGRIGDGWFFSGSSLYAVKSIDIQVPVELTDEIINQNYKDADGHAVYKSTDGKYYYDKTTDIITTHFDGSSGDITIVGNLTSSDGNVILNGISLIGEETKTTNDGDEIITAPAKIRFGDDGAEIWLKGPRYKIDEETKKAVTIADDSSYTTGALTIKAPNSIAIQSDDNIWIGSTGEAGYLFINETNTKSEDFIRMQQGKTVVQVQENSIKLALDITKEGYGTSTDTTYGICIDSNGIQIAPGIVAVFGE